MAELNQGLYSLKRLSAAVESSAERKVLADAVSQLRSILKNLEAVPVEGGRG
jgi:hypothetical protein